MASDFSFDIVGLIDMQEVLNAVNQANKEITQRYDFKGSTSEITLNQKDNSITIISDDSVKMNSVIDILHSKFVKRKVSLKALEYLSIENASGGNVRQVINLQSGISDSKCKEIVKFIKSTKLKIQAQIQDSQVRVSSKKKDDLQQIIQLIKDYDFDIFMEFVNYR